jgi:hypothetical protein
MSDTTPTGNDTSGVVNPYIRHIRREHREAGPHIVGRLTVPCRQFLDSLQFGPGDSRTTNSENGFAQADMHPPQV